MAKSGFSAVDQVKSDRLLGTLMRHGGSMDGFLSNLHRYSDDKLPVIVLANIRKFPIRNLTFELKEIALGIPLGEHTRETLE